MHPGKPLTKMPSSVMKGKKEDKKK